MKTKIIIVLFISIFAYSCKNDSKIDEGRNAYETSRRKTVQSTQQIDDSIAKQMRDMFGKKSKTYQSMIQADSLVKEIAKLFNLNMQQFLEGSNISNIEK